MGGRLPTSLLGRPTAFAAMWMATSGPQQDGQEKASTASTCSRPMAFSLAKSICRKLVRTCVSGVPRKIVSSWPRASLCMRYTLGLRARRCREHCQYNRRQPALAARNRYLLYISKHCFFFRSIAEAPYAVHTVSPKLSFILIILSCGCFDREHGFLSQGCGTAKICAIASIGHPCRGARWWTDRNHHDRGRVSGAPLWFPASNSFKRWQAVDTG